MKLHQIDKDQSVAIRSEKALRHLVDHPVPPEVRPCMSCIILCECSGSTSCGCGCSVDCEHAPANLSSEPEEFSIESGIYPLVYAIASLGTCPPFWSCEGHLDNVGVISRIPRVWFYARDLSYPRLIQDHLSNLAGGGELQYKWHVCLTFSDGDNIDTAFSLEPNVAMNEEMKLDLLRQDITVIAENFVYAIKHLADRLIANTTKV
jgi:hypothetical protein